MCAQRLPERCHTLLLRELAALQPLLALADDRGRERLLARAFRAIAHEPTAAEWAYYRDAHLCAACPVTADGVHRFSAPPAAAPPRRPD